MSVSEASGATGTPGEISARGYPKVRCHAHKTNGEPCPQWAMRGQKVCRTHGGASPQAQRRARMRVIELLEPAVAVTARIMADNNAKDADRLRAAESILDRGGMPRGVEVNVDEAREILRLRLREIVAAAAEPGEES